MSANFEQAKTFFLQGLGHYEAGRYEEAEREFAASLALVPGRASTLTNLGATRVKLGRWQDALDLLDEALAQEPGNAEALGHKAMALAELGHHAQALSCVERVLDADPSPAPLWSLRGSLLKEMDRLDEAAAAWREALALGADPELHRYYLAALSGAETPPAAPRQYVESLFDSYADGFDTHLIEVLGYRIPEVLVDELRRMDRRFDCALDLGCGTGLCGPLLKPLAARLDGVDLSAHMVEAARSRNVYDELTHADVVDYLAATARRYDLVLAADVFIYVGALDRVFESVKRVMPSGGVFCFSVELSDEGHDLQLRSSLRYAHSARYIQKLAEQYGFEISRTADHSIRDDQGKPIAGLCAWLVMR